MSLRYVLISEGSDDRMLQAPIDWLLEIHCSRGFAGEWANPAAMENKSRVVETRLSQTMAYYPCDITFVHRDVDNANVDDRLREITEAQVAAGYPSPLICVVPVRMTEAWFLFDEAAIRRAAGNPNSLVRLNLPTAQEVQRRADPKNVMAETLVIASELSGRKLKQFRAEMSYRKSLVASYIDDFSPLRSHSSFAAFERDLVGALETQGWSR